MGFWSYLAGSLAWGVEQGWFGITNSAMYDNLYEIVNGSRVLIETDTPAGQAAAYRRCTAVRSAINKRATAHANMNVWALNDRGRSIMNSTVKGDLELLNSKFNEYQTFRRFSHMYTVMKLLFGRVYIWKVPIKYSSDFYYYIVPNVLITAKYKNETSVSKSFNSKYDRTFDRIVDHYEINLFGETLPLRADEIIVNYDNHIGLFSGSTSSSVYEPSDSRLTALSLPVSTMTTIEEMEHQFMADGGARGIIGLGARDVDMITAPFLTSERDEIQKELKKYGGLRNQFRFLVSKGAATYTNMMPKVDDMKMPEIYLQQKQELFDAYGIPMAFTTREPRFKSMPEAKLMFYTDTVVPEGQDTVSELLELRGIPKREWRYAPDWSHLDIYQDALSKRAAALQMAAQGIGSLVASEVISSAEAKDLLDSMTTETIFQ